VYQLIHDTKQTYKQILSICEEISSYTGLIEIRKLYGNCRLREINYVVAKLLFCVASGSNAKQMEVYYFIHN
jgi:hypothetical protein